MPISYRPAHADDARLVIDSWVSAYKYAHAAGLIALEDWDSIMRPQVAKVLRRPGCDVWVAYDPAETDKRFDLFGWIAVERGYSEVVRRRRNGRWEEHLEVADRPLVHFVFVKRSYRREGIARGLCEAAGVDLGAPLTYTCKTAVVSKLNLPAAEWKPLIARHRPSPRRTEPE